MRGGQVVGCAKASSAAAADHTGVISLELVIDRLYFRLRNSPRIADLRAGRGRHHEGDWLAPLGVGIRAVPRPLRGIIAGQAVGAAMPPTRLNISREGGSQRDCRDGTESYHGYVFHDRISDGGAIGERFSDVACRPVGRRLAGDASRLSPARGDRFGDYHHFSAVPGAR